MKSPIRMLTATAIFDGHDAAINIMRRLLQDQGVEVIHLGHNHGVDAVVKAAIEEDVDAVAISSYQGGHMEYFSYLLAQLKEKTTAHAGHSMLVFGGGGGTITTAEKQQLEQQGVSRIYGAEDGIALGLDGIAEDIIKRCLQARQSQGLAQQLSLVDGASVQLNDVQLAQQMSLLETGVLPKWLRVDEKIKTRVLGITGTGGSGKSTLIDEILATLLAHEKALRIAFIAIDPSRRKTGGALLGDRIRLNSQSQPRLFMRSLATRADNSAITQDLKALLHLLDSQNFDLIFVETAGIGQSDAAIVPYVDESIYVMTSEYGAPSQLEKIEMLDLADHVILNKFDLPGSEDALCDVRKQWCRNHKLNDTNKKDVPVFPMVASQFNDAGLVFYLDYLQMQLGLKPHAALKFAPLQKSAESLIPAHRASYLKEIVLLAKQRRRQQKKQLAIIADIEAYYRCLKKAQVDNLPDMLQPCNEAMLSSSLSNDPWIKYVCEQYNQSLLQLDDESKRIIERYAVVAQQNKKSQESLSHLSIATTAIPTFQSKADLLAFLQEENLPGEFPFTAGIFPGRRENEEATRMFAGEGTPEDTNRRFFYLKQGQKSIRLSTAFDPITLYGQDPDQRPDVLGCIGMSGVSVATLDDMKKLYSGINLCAENTSVSMTINGPAAILLAWFFHAAIDQQVELYLKENGLWQQAEKTLRDLRSQQKPVAYMAELPAGHDGLGLALLGVSGEQLLDAENYQRIANETLQKLRGTLQADILKEEMAQNENIFALPFALQLMADTQAYFIEHQIKHFYAVSVSGYHIAEAGANPITQLAFTLANGFTLLEYYLARGMKVDDFASQFSFFFSNGMDPEYAVIGRVARRIWALAMRDRYAANTRCQKLKYHIQTSGRSLQAQDIELNDIRTTLQALYAVADNCNSLHTNAYDEAVTTPTEESVHRALAIQMIINRELGLAVNQNPLQGSFFIQQLSRQVEEAVYEEFESLSRRGGVFGAMETFYQRNKIQQESLYYENQKNDGSLPIVGVNTFFNPDEEQQEKDYPLIRCSEAKKQQQVTALLQFKSNHKQQAKQALKKLKKSLQDKQNSFSCLMKAAPICSLGQMAEVLLEVGGACRRKM